MRTLVLASEGSRKVIRGVYQELQLREPDEALTVAQAFRAIEQTDTPYDLLVAALGTKPEEFLLDPLGSPLIEEIHRKHGQVIVFSRTACRHKQVEQACMDAGARTVLCDARSLKRVILGLMGSVQPQDTLTAAMDLPISPLMPSEVPRRVICRAGGQTTRIVRALCDGLGVLPKNFSQTPTIAATLDILQSQDQTPNPFDLIVAALGTCQDELLLDEQGPPFGSSLLRAAAARGVTVIVYSHTALRDQRLGDQCVALGASAVVNSRSTLESAIRTAMRRRSLARPLPRAAAQGGVDASVPPDSAESAESAESALCAICMDNKRDSLILPCRHFFYCSECLSSHRRTHTTCPTCKGTIADVIGGIYS